jgi:PAS domain S-box-containing protein/diguanylate cyclase (GGDEF)-like protein
MTERVRILLAEDAANDAELALAELKRSGLHYAHRIVDSEKSFVGALHEFKPDVILSDFSMPGFDGMTALALAREICPDTPFIFVSGAMGEETAIDALKSGATDYVLKSNLVRLPSAVERARAEAVARRERRRTDAQLRESESLKGAILESSLDCLITVDHEGKIVEFNPAAEATFGLTREQALGKVMVDLIVPPRLRSAHRRGFAHYLATGEGSILGKRLELEAIRADGTEFPIELAITAIGATSKPMFTGFVRDITARKEFEEKIKRLNRVYAVLSGINSIILRAGDRNELFRDASRIAIEHGGFRMAWIGMVDKEAGIVKPVASAGDVRDFFETAPLAITENKPGGLGLAGRAVGEMKPMISNDVRNDPQRLMRKEMDERGINSLAVIPLIVGGEAVGVLSLYAGELGFFDSEEMKLLIDLAGNISFALEHIESEEKVRYLAYYDSLTGLANRTLFLERLAQYLSAAGREQQQLALVVVNIERFKTINDTFGRQVGDALLTQVADRLLELAKDPSRVARVSADHFAVVIPHLKHDEESLIRGLEVGNQRVDGDPYTVGSNEIRISTRSGVALFPSNGNDADTLFRNAEAALKKSSSGERYLFYTKEMTERIAEKVALENKLRQALEKDEFVLYYQPKVNVDTRRMVSVEALIRWRSPELGLVAPMQFIPLLEETGLILQVGLWALKRASLDHRGWVDLGLKAPRTAVNVSPIQLRQRDFVDVLKQAIIGGVAPPGIDLEITEGVVMEDIQVNIEKLTAVHALGVNIAIDDFGTGYSSLGYLAKLPVQSLKIDRSFIIAMVEDSDTMTLVSTIISLAHSLRLKVVAEGVDSEDQAKHLRRLRCDEMQGYLFSKPLPRDELTALLEPNA